MNNIEGLQESVRSSLRSSIILFDLPRVVEELTHNSVDSGATEVHVSLSVSECHVKVEDNGCGIARDGLVILGERYATSKIDLSIDPQANSESLGFRAEALASLSDVSLVEIRTKARGRPNAYCKIMKGSKCLFFGIDDQREAVGTTVIVRDLFYNQPVRRKYMLNSPKRVLHTTKKCVFRIALVHPQVSFKVIDKDSEDELLCTIPSSSPLSLVLDGFGHEVSRSLHKIVFSEQMLMLSGYISGRSNAFSTKDFQYLYINSRFVCKCPIHDLLNNLASTPLCSMAQHKVEPDSQSEKRQRTRAYPAYLLNLCCPVTSYDLYFEPSKTFVEFKDWNPILSFLERAIKQFWKQLSEDLLKGKSFGQDNIVTIESEVQKEEMLTTDILMNSEMKREQCNLWLHPNSPLHSPISSPQAMILEHVNIFQKDGILSKEMPLSSVLRPCQNLTNRRCQPECTSQHVTHDTYDDFTSEHGHMDCSNSNFPQWITDVGSSTLDRHFFSNQTLTFEDKDDKAELETDLPESSSCLRKELHRRTLISHPYEFTSNAEQMQFPFASPCASSKVDTEVSFLMENDKDHSVYYTDSFNQFKNNSSLNAPAVGATEADFHNDSLSPDTIFHAKFDFSSPCSVTRKCQIARELDVTSIDHIGCFTIEEPFLSIRKNLHQGVAARVFVASPKFVSPEVGWHLDSRDELFARKVTQGDTLRGELEDSRSVGYRYHDTAKMIESLNSDTPIEVLTASHKKRKLHYQKYLSPKKTKQHDFSIDRTTVEKLGSSSTVYDETDWSLETSDRKVTNIYNDAEFKMCGKNQDVLAENQYDEQKFESYQQPNACKIMSYRSSSSPPFYTGKQKFPVLKDHHRTAGKDSSLQSSYDANTSPDGLSEASASQPYPKPKYDEVSQPSFSIDVNLGTIEMNGLQNLERLEKEHHNPSSPCNAIAGFINGEMEYASATLTKWRTGIPQPIGGDVSYGSHHSPQNKDEILNVCSVHFSDSSLVPQSISRDCLDDARVLLQLDRKFIPVVAGGILIVIDQHAADERIRLEELRRKVLLEEGSSIAYLDSEKELVLPEMGFQLLQKYVEPIQRWGWICSINTQASESFAKNMNLLKRRAHGVTLTAVPCILGIKLTDKDLIEFIEQLVETDGSSTIPPAVLRILNYKACRGAIMFGDSLLPSECSLIVEELKATSLCFQCAHGRPTTVPLLNMASLHDLLTAQEMEKGSPRDSWHGLQRYAPSVERAQLRLESAKRFRGG